MPIKRRGRKNFKRHMLQLFICVQIIFANVANIMNLHAVRVQV